MSTKRHPGPFDCYAKLADDEPYFLLRGGDIDGPDVVREWIRRRRARAFDEGTPIPSAYEAKLQEAAACATAMQRYRADKLVRGGK